MASTKGTLFNLREELVDGPVKHEFSNIMKRNEILGPNFGSVEDVKVKLVFVLLLDNLDGKVPFGENARFNGLFQILTVEICKGLIDISKIQRFKYEHTRVLTAYFQSFVPDEAVYT